MNLRLYKLPTAKVLLKLELDTEDQVLFYPKKTLLEQKALKAPLNMTW